jgi:hypothetical protein
MTQFIISIFFGALLLFQVQPVMARYILPWFGGSPAVWTTAMLFFQCMLLIGYGYTHFLVRRLTLRKQIMVHLTLVAVSLILLPITPSESLKPTGLEDPVWKIISLLLLSVGAPFLLLSSTAPLIQAWFARVHSGRTPYQLYAISNMGSLIGLLSYPFLIEPMIGLHTQTYMWSFAYAAFAGLLVWTAIPLYRLARSSENTEPSTPDTPEKTPLSQQLLWVTLSALGVVILLAATNQLTKDVAVVPLLWIIPLTLYLLSFVMTFGVPRLYHRPFWGLVLVVSAFAVTYLLNEDYADGEINLFIQIFIYSLIVLSGCVVCHGELYHLRPPSQNLTLFYLMLSLGGAMGGVFVNLVAPLIFKGYWEFHLSIVLVCILFGYLAFVKPPSDIPRKSKMLLQASWVACLGCLIYLLGIHIDSQRERTLESKRNFYGIMRVYENSKSNVHALHHGRIEHGNQILDPKHKTMPTSYYGRNSGVGIAIMNKRFDMDTFTGLRIGVIGQGTATLAAYGQKGDVIRFYEINPDVSELAEKYFTYMSDSKATIEVIPGDARISMEREPAQNYDILVVDAFSGDGIPVHLLTREALELYQSHLAKDGIIAFHISNLHFDLRPVVQALAIDQKLTAIWIENIASGSIFASSDWMLMTNSQRLVTQFYDYAKPFSVELSPNHLWTDDYANVLKVLRKN